MLFGGRVQVKLGLMPRTLFVTGTTFFGCVMEFESLGSPASVMDVPWEASEVTPLISTLNDTELVAGFTNLTKIAPVWRLRVAQPCTGDSADVVERISSPRFRLNIWIA